MKPKSPTPPSAAKKAKLKADRHWAVVSECGHVCFGYDSAAMIHETERECRTRADFAKMREQVLPVTVLPHATAADARRFAAFWNLSEGERETKLCILIYRQLHGKEPHPEYERGYIENARQILALFAGKGAKR